MISAQVNDRLLRYILYWSTDGKKSQRFYSSGEWSALVTMIVLLLSNTVCIRPLIVLRCLLYATYSSSFCMSTDRLVHGPRGI